MEIIKIILAIIDIIIKKLELYCKNYNLSIGKSVIQFEPYSQKSDINKYSFYVIFLLFYVISKVIIINRGIYLF